MKTVLQVKVLNLWGGIPVSTTIQVDGEHIPAIYTIAEPDQPARRFRLKSCDQIKANMYRVTYVQERK